MKISYNWLQNYFDEKLPKSEEIAEAIIFHSFEVEEQETIKDDTIFEIKILPDRAHDCLSHFGIAKEVSAIFDLKIKEQNYKSFDEKNTDLDIKIEDDKCLRYMGRIVRNIQVGESPLWLKTKLNVIGQKSINNIVDAANYVMYDLGQPIHCFDLDKLENSKIIVRNGKGGEKITTLDKREIEIDDSILVITDEAGPLAIAGIKGGTKAEVDKNTKNIVIEVANFNPITTRKTSKKIGILTDAVKRYENEITPELCSVAMDAITSTIFDLAGGEVENIIDVYNKKPEVKNIDISTEYINKRLGSNFSKEDIESVWKKLNFEFSELEDKFNVRIPFLRLDLNGPHDLTEEVIRILGYDKLIEKIPEINKIEKISNIFEQTLLARHILLDSGYSEVMTYVFKDKGDIEVLASANGKNFLRNNLTDGLKDSISLNQKNLPLLGVDEVRVFEIGTVFTKDGEKINLAYGDKKKVVEMLLVEFLSLPENKVFTLHDFILKELHTKSEMVGDVFPKIFKPWSIYPFITRDIAVWVPEGTKPQVLIDIYNSFGTELLVTEPKLFDSYTKDGKTSFAYRLVFQSYDKTLTDNEVNAIMTEITNKVISLGWEVR